MLMKHKMSVRIKNFLYASEKNNKNFVNECFVGFSDLCDLVAKALAEKIVATLQVLCLSVTVL